jgi:hypothetical protein
MESTGGRATVNGERAKNTWKLAARISTNYISFHTYSRVTAISSFIFYDIPGSREI